MDSAEKKRFERSSDPAQREFCLGRLMLKTALAEKLNCSANKLIFSYSESAKPYLPDSPFQFSISHCKSAVAVVIANQDVGLDIEQIDRRRASHIKAPWQRAGDFLNSEMAQIIEALSCREAEKARLFAQFWTCFEAFVKLKASSIFALRDSFKLSIEGESYRALDPLCEDHIFRTWQAAENEVMSLAYAVPEKINTWLWRSEGPKPWAPALLCS